MRRLTLTFLLGCTGADKPVTDSAPSDSGSDSGVDSAADSGGETSPHSGDTSETSDSGDSGSTDTATPGPCDSTSLSAYGPPTYVVSDLEGWEDADCSEPSPGRALTIQVPSPFLVEGRFLAGEPSPGPQQLTIQLRDCVGLDCKDGVLDPALPYLAVSLDASGRKTNELRGLGVWGPDLLRRRRVVGRGHNYVMEWANDGTAGCAAVTVCLERVRPDVIKGVVRTETNVPEFYAAAGWDVQFYDSVVFRYPFEVQLDEHAGFDTTQPEAGTAPAGYSTARYLYDVPYDDAWPWAAITDAAARTDLHDRYTPYNQP